MVQAISCPPIRLYQNNQLNIRSVWKFALCATAAKDETDLYNEHCKKKTKGSQLPYYKPVQFMSGFLIGIPVTMLDSKS